MDGVRPNQGAASGFFPEINHWYHVVGTFDGIAMRLYVNGERIDSNFQSGSIAIENRRSIWIGRDTIHEGRTHGRIDEVKIYTRALSPEEIRSNFNSVSSENIQP